MSGGTVVLAALLLAWPAAVSTQSRDQAESLLREAEKATQAEDFRAAERLYRAASAANPRSPEASCGLGQALLALREFEEAVPALEGCKRDVLKSLRDAQARQARAWADVDREIREVEESLQAIRSGRTRSAGPGQELRLEERVRELQQARGRDPVPVRVEVPARVSFALGSAYLSAGLPEKAEWEFVAVLRSDPGAGTAHNNLATVYLMMGRFEEAAEQVRRAEEAGVRVSLQMKADIAARYSPGAAPATSARSARSPGPEAPAITLEHEGRTCAVKGRFLRVEATVTPSWGVHDPTLYFRTEEAPGWYSTFLLPAGENDFATFLPKTGSAESLTYFIEVKSYDEKTIRSPDYSIAVARDESACAEASADPDEVATVLIIDTPKEDADAPPVPRGFSIRGTTADAGVLEVGPNKALVYGGLGLAGGIAAGVVAATSGGGAYEGPEPFAEAPGIELLSTDPPSGSSLSRSQGHLVVQLRIFSVESLPGARISADLSNFWGPCIRLSTTHDLPARRATTVVLSGPTVTLGEPECRLDRPMDQLHVSVTGANGFGGFQTGIPPLSHFSVHFVVVD